MNKYRNIIFFLTLFFLSLQGNAQYFGENKPRYDNFKFNVYQTKNLELYSYLKNDSLVRQFLYSGEKWFRRHQITIKDSFDYKIPIILYNDHADFQQTTAIGGNVGVGTGGVTEALKTRIMMPIRPSYGQTKHVLGHEMVHAFQYNIIKSDDSLSFNNLANVSLWMVEGMAEYLSLGRYDEHTAMWMRDAVINKDFPKIKDLYKSKYFPYRYGQDFWAYIGGTYGDDKIEKLFYATLKLGFKKATDSLLRIKADSLSKQWKTANETYYKQFITGRDSLALGKILFDKENAGNMNVAPSISPDGKKMIFLSEKNVISMDLYLADLATDKITRIASKSMNNHIDAIDAFESSGAWSPDSKKFTFVVFKKGKNQLAVVDVNKTKVSKIINIPELPAFSNPVWSPDGKKILLLGQVEGVSNLYLFNLENKSLKQLTHDAYAEMQASWSLDGKKIIFSTDYYYLKRNLYPIKYHIGILDVETGIKTYPKIFPGANNMNPKFDKTGKTIYFLSDNKGFRDLYRYEIPKDSIYQMTKFFTGISGITKFSPAYSINYAHDEIIYNYFFNHQYMLVKNKISKFYQLPVTDQSIDIAPSLLPPKVGLNTSFVERLLRNKYENLQVPVEKKPYKPKFKLDYISNVNMGMSTSTYGSGMMGGVSMIFSDILGKHQLYTAASLNGEIYDFAAMAAYFNQSRRIGWGGSISHIPYSYYYQRVRKDTVQIGGQNTPVDNYKIYTVRMFEEKFGLFTSYPLSKNMRLELGGSLAHYSYKITSYNHYFDHYDPYGYHSHYYGSLKKNEKSPKAFNFHEMNTAFVGDNSVFGVTAPLKGQRYRIGFKKYFGRNNLNTFLVDYRKYFYLKPIVLAFKGMHYNRFGKDAEKNYYNSRDGVLPPLYLGYDYYVRGYSYSAMYESQMLDPSSVNYTDLMGSKMLLANFEIRLPFSGPERLSLIKSGVFFTDLNLFFDAGLVWDSKHKLAFKKDAGNRNVRYPIYSTGLSMRINFFGQIIIQPYYAFPLSLAKSKGYFGINFYPGF